MTVETLAGEGDGIARHKSFALFIPQVVPGDRVRARVTEVKRNFGRARVQEIEKPGAGRVPAPCPFFEQCGGCAWQQLDDSAQLEWKHRLVRDAIERIGGLESVEVLPVLGMENPWHYRNKASIPFRRQEEKTVAGFFEPGSHRVVDIDACLIQHPTVNAILDAARELVRERGLPPYEEEQGTGLIRHLVARVGAATGEALAALVVNAPGFAGEAEFARELMEQVPELVGVVLNVNRERTNVIFGDETRTLAGRDYLKDELGGYRFLVSARSFYQVNPAQTEVLYGKALEFAGLTGEETVLDLYAGIGTISLFLSSRARRVVGVEEIPEAVEDARRNAEANDVTNCEFRLDRVEAALPRLLGEGIRPDVVVVDPPRKGLAPEVVESLLASRPPRIVYVSCNPATLARDLSLLADAYRIEVVQPVDMFPHTAHVESCTLLVRKPD